MRDGAGDLRRSHVTARVTTHAVSNEKEPVTREARVLVVRANNTHMAANGAFKADVHAYGLSSKVVVPIVTGVKAVSGTVPVILLPLTLVPLVESRSVIIHCEPLRNNLAW